MAQEVIDEFLGREIDCLNSFINGEIELQREQIQTKLNTIQYVINGSSTFLPSVAESNEKLDLVESQVQIVPMKFIFKPDDRQLTFKGKNLRESMIVMMDKLQKHLLEHHVDDHKSLHSIGKNCALK